ncbi:hypothetical protein GOP47_0012005 [Adiantum capillus-veneris]|uniref:Uncharacterized protein n=1 Tax=Adiantum capillus-veneris TaxID=13818 RepID=A0A9D4UV23_ADICA|nr:hypothetical protein GOP47_0012005 [Adiantum capillus-veneris]
MAAFGSFAGLAAAGAGALCSAEEDALNCSFSFFPRFKSTTCEQVDVPHVVSGRPRLPIVAAAPSKAAGAARAESSSTGRGSTISHFVSRHLSLQQYCLNSFDFL